ncbi:MAG: hypothetical protein JW808_07855 [Victivallales bacterium]|nr:hypothetical protein [Victivallales bacterium]
MDFNDFDPPSGVSISWTERSLRITLRFNALINLGLVLSWILVSVFAAILIFSPETLRFRPHDISLPLVAGIWAGLSLIFYICLSLRTVIEAGEKNIKTRHLPFHLPLTSIIPVSDISLIDIESIIRDRNENRPVCFFNVVASMKSTHRRPLIFSTQDEGQAVFITEILSEYLAQSENFFGIAVDLSPSDDR